MIKQFVPSRTCLQCRGCCRFIEAESIWQPLLLESEAADLSKSKEPQGYITKNKRICLVPSKNQDIFYCVFFDACKNRCRIYSRRPFDCQLYPFLINRRGCRGPRLSGVSYLFLSSDLNCPFVKDNIESKSFQKYISYLARLLNSRKYRQILKNNPQVIQYYPEAQDVAELDL